MRPIIMISLGLMLTVGLLAVLVPAEQASAYGWGSRPISGSYHPDAPPAIFLDVDGNLSIDATYQGFKPIYATSGNDGWQAVNDWSGGAIKRYPSWNALVYPGPVAPPDAKVTLDDAVDAWYYIYVSMEMPPANMTGYYKLELWISTTSGLSWHYGYQMVLTFIGNGIHETAYPYYHQSDNYASVHTTINPTGSLGPSWYGTLNESPLTGLPWQASDFAGDWGIWLDYNQDETPTPVRITTIWAALVPTTGPPPGPVGNEILRPNGDICVPDNWFIHPPGSAYDAVDETTLYSDNDTSYISTGSLVYTLSFSMTDPSETLGTDGSFNLTLWVVAKSNEFYSSNRLIRVGLTSGYYPLEEQEATAYTGYHNMTFSFPTNPGTGQPWTFNELTDLKLFIGGDGNLTISQAAVIVSDIDYIPPDERGEAWSIIHWVSGNGIMTMFAILGFFGMIATPTLAYLGYKNGEEGLLAGANGIWLMVLFFGLFVIGLWAGRG